MSQKIAKMLRKYSKVNWMEYVTEVKKLPFTVRWRYCWYILWGKKK